MALPDVTLNILDGALGILPPNTSKVQLKIGCAPKGLISTVQGVGDVNTLQALFGKGGPLVESSAMALAAGPLLCLAANPSTYGTPGTVTKGTVGTGSTSTLTVTAKPFTGLVVKCAVGGTLATATLQVSTDGGATYGAAFVSAATVMLPGVSFVTIACSAGTYTAGDTWTIGTDGTVVFSGSGNNGVTLSTACPVDAYALVVTCTSGGALGAAQFTYSLDGGNTTSGTLLVPASGKYVIPDTGILLTFTNALVTTDAWSCPVTTASYASGDLTTAMTAALADARTWGFVHVIGPASSVANAATLLASLDTQLATAASAYRFAAGLLEVPTDTDANTISGFAASSSLRVAAVAGYEWQTSGLNGRQMSRPAAWTVAARAAQAAVSDDLGKVISGPLTGASFKATNSALAAGRDETATPGLDAARFTTLRSLIGRQGVFITTGRIMAPGGSDYSLWQNRRVMDVACSTVRNTLLNFLNSSVRVNKDGSIYENDARTIEAQCVADLNAALVQPGDASSASVVVNRSANILSTQTLPVSIRVVPLGYAKTISVDIGFTNPASLVTR